MVSRSALYASGSVSLTKSLDLIETCEVEVSADGVLEAGRCNCEVDCILLVLEVGKSIDDTSRKGVTTTNSINDICNLIMS